MRKKTYRLKEIGPFFKSLPDDLTLARIDDLRKLLVVRVKWLDACSDSGWYTLAEYRGYGDGIECESVGFLIRNNEKVIQIIQSFGQSGKMSESLTIPKSEVRGVRVLK